VLWEQELDGSGTLRITYGRKYIRTISDGGFMLTLVRKLGTNHSCTLKVGAGLSTCPCVLLGLAKIADTAFPTGRRQKIAYCIAFSIDGATDVTRRYVRNFQRDGLDRTRVPEEVLLYIIHEIRSKRREGMDKEQKRRLLLEDAREERELASYVAKALVNEMAAGSYGASDLSNTEKHLYRRTTGMLFSPRL
jgi:hypothetical protein